MTTPTDLAERHFWATISWETNQPLLSDSEILHHDDSCLLVNSEDRLEIIQFDHQTLAAT